MSAQTTQRRETSRGTEHGRELHYIRNQGFDEAVLEGRPFTYRALCGEEWTTEPGDLGFMPSEAERAQPRICLDCEWRYEQMKR